MTSFSVDSCLINMILGVVEKKKKKLNLINLHLFPFFKKKKKSLRVPNEHVNISEVEMDYLQAGTSAVVVERGSGDFWRQSMMEYTISQGLSQEEEKTKGILNIILGKDQKQALSFIYSFAVEL